jgi:hypothetical protein
VETAEAAVEMVNVMQMISAELTEWIFPSHNN